MRGYAVTAHRSQGKSVDSVVISGDGMRKELFYVAASRGRESITVVTSDKELLRESVARSDVRQSASELARKGQEISLEEKPPRLTLREREQNERSVVREEVRDTTQEVVEPSRKAPPAGTVQTIDRENATHEKNQEHITELGQYGISR